MSVDELLTLSWSADNALPMLVALLDEVDETELVLDTPLFSVSDVEEIKVQNKHKLRGPLKLTTVL